MWCEKLKNGKYKYGDRYYNPLKKKYCKVSITLDRKDDRQAVKLLDKKIQEKQYKASIDSITISECIKKYLDYKITKIKPSTYTLVKGGLLKVAESEYANLEIKDINAMVFRELLEVFPNNKANLTVYLKTFCKWAYKNDYISDINFLQKIDMPSRKKKKNKMLYIEKEELKNILCTLHNESSSYMDRIYAYIMEFQALTGLRVGELIALTTEDFYKEEGVYYINVNKTYSLECNSIQTPKTKCSNRVIAVNNRCVEIISKCKVLRIERELQGYKFENKNNLLFANSRGNYIHIGNYNKFLKRINVDYSSHILRHTHASILAEEGIGLDAIQRRLGHENDDITRGIYVHITNKMQRKDDNTFSKLKIL